MSINIISKKCPGCNEIKSISEYWKHTTRYDGVQVYCKTCMKNKNKKYAETEKGKNTFRQARKKYRETTEGKQKIKQYRKEWVKTRAGRLYKLKNVHQNKRRFPEKYIAIQKVHSAVKSGKLPHISTKYCFCTLLANEYHHFMGYSPKHWYDVIPLCYHCHKLIHRKVFSAG